MYTVKGHCVSATERWASGAANGRSEARAEAIGGRLQALVRLGLPRKLSERASQSVQEPLQRIAGTLTRWCEPIVRYIRNRYTNGMTAGCNKKIKLIPRMADGWRHAHKRQKRMLAWCGAP